jgi:hypothetical protein
LFEPWNEFRLCLFLMAHSWSAAHAQASGANQACNILSQSLKVLSVTLSGEEGDAHELAHGFLEGCVPNWPEPGVSLKRRKEK